MRPDAPAVVVPAEVHDAIFELEFRIKDRCDRFARHGHAGWAEASPALHAARDALRAAILAYGDERAAEAQAELNATYIAATTLEETPA